MIHPDAQRAMSKRAGSKTVEVKESHAVNVSQPETVADLIAGAAQGQQSLEASVGSVGVQAVDKTSCCFIVAPSCKGSG